MIAVLAFTLRFALAIVLAVAAVAKARSFGAFVRTVDAVVPWQRTARAAAVAVIAVEMTLAVLLAAGGWVNAVSLATLALFLGFAAVSLWAARHELHVRCNCFGRSDRELGKDSLVTSLLLAGATVAYWALLRRTDDSLTLGEVPLAVVLGAVTVLAARLASYRGRRQAADHRDAAGPHGRRPLRRGPVRLRAVRIPTELHPRPRTGLLGDHRLRRRADASGRGGRARARAASAESGLARLAGDSACHTPTTATAQALAEASLYRLLPAKRCRLQLDRRGRGRPRCRRRHPRFPAVGPTHVCTS